VNLKAQINHKFFKQPNFTNSVFKFFRKNEFESKIEFQKLFKKKVSLICNSIWFHTFADEILEEKFELIATSLKKC